MATSSRKSGYYRGKRPGAIVRFIERFFHRLLWIPKQTRRRGSEGTRPDNLRVPISRAGADDLRHYADAPYFMIAPLANFVLPEPDTLMVRWGEVGGLGWAINCVEMMSESY